MTETWLVVYRVEASDRFDALKRTFPRLGSWLDNRRGLSVKAYAYGDGMFILAERIGDIPMVKHE